MRGHQATLAPHGTYVRAQICTDECRECAPVKARQLATSRAVNARYLAASHEGKRLAGRLPSA